MYYLLVLYRGIWYNDILLFPINLDVGMIFCIGMLRSDYQKSVKLTDLQTLSSLSGSTDVNWCQLMSTDVNWCQLMSTEHCITIPTLHWFSLSGSSKRGWEQQPTSSSSGPLSPWRDRHLPTFGICRMVYVGNDDSFMGEQWHSKWEIQIRAYSRGHSLTNC